jgi:uncharacterized membrane protein YkvI
MEILNTTLFIVGTVIGAGFISGAELIRFFPCEAFLIPTLLSAALLCAMTVFFLYLGRVHGGYRGCVLALFGKGAPVVFVLVTCSCFVTAAGMLAGLDALLPSLKPLLSILGLAGVCLFLMRGMKGISLLNALLVPVILLFVFFGGSGGKSLSYPVPPSGTFNGVLGGVVYAGLNAFLAAPVLMEAGKERKQILLPSLFATAIVCACAVLILGKVYREGAGAIHAEMPFLYVMRGKKIFYAACALAILTSLASSVYPILSACEKIKKRSAKNAAKGAVLVAAFALSRIGLGGIVDKLYPVLGMFGIALVLFGGFYEYLFQKRNQKIHQRRKQAEDASRAHNKVEFKHLPAVNDQIAQPRFGNDVFAHDRADPSHTDVHFQHRNKGSERRRDYKFSQYLKFRCAHRSKK